mgnify:CR=1 FL=1|jgi:hypothetical protein
MINVVRFFQNLFPLKASGLEEFIAILKREGCTEINAFIEVSEPRGNESPTVGSIGNFAYSVILSGKTSNDRPITYRHLVTKRFGSTRGFFDQVDDNKAIVKTMVAAYDLLEEINRKIPGVSTSLLKPDGKPFSEDMRKQLFKDAKKMRLI